MCLHHLICFAKKCCVQVILSLPAPSPAFPRSFHRKPFLVSRQAVICTSLSQTAAGLPGGHPNSFGMALQVVQSSGQGLCVQVSCLMDSRSSPLGGKPYMHVFALLAGCRKSSCLLMDDNLHNNTECSDHARRERAHVSCFPV